MKRLRKYGAHRLFEPIFWDAFLKKSWDKKPGVYRFHAPGQFVSEQVLFEALQALRAYTTQRHSYEGFVRVYVEEGELSNEDQILPLLPSEKDRSVESYSARVLKLLKGKKYGVVFNHVHSFNETLWKSVRSAFHPFFQAQGIPMGHVSVDCFLGNYKRTPFGVHKDELHVFTLPIRGHREILLWDFSDLLRVYPWVKNFHADLDEFKHASSQRLGISKTLPQKRLAYALKADPGELMYWPPPFWHVLKGDGTFKMSLTVGVGVTPTPKNYDDLLPKIDFERTFVTSATQKKVFAKPARACASMMDPDILQNRFINRVLEIQSSTGFWPPFPKKNKTVLSKDSIISVDPRFPILTRRFGRSLVCFANGHRITLAFHPFLKDLIALLNSGTSYEVSLLIEALAAKHGAVDQRGLISLLKELDKCRVFITPSSK